MRNINAGMMLAFRIIGRKNEKVLCILLYLCGTATVSAKQLHSFKEAYTSVKNGDNIRLVINLRIV